MKTQWLKWAGILTLAASCFHVAVPFGKPGWYRMVGAPERMAQAARGGLWWPAIVTLGLAVVLLGCALYAFSGAGLLRELPLRRTVLAFISTLLTLRILALVPFIYARPDLLTWTELWTAAAILPVAVCYVIGTSILWRRRAAVYG